MDNNNWIDVNDKLPEASFPILFYAQSIGCRLGSRCPNNRKIEWFREWGNRANFKNITHWQPLPSPPTIIK